MTTEKLPRALLKVRPGARWTLFNDVPEGFTPEEGVLVPGVPGLVWLDDTHPMPTPEELDAAMVTVWREPVIEEFKAERERLLNRMMSIAGRMARQGDATFAAALDALAEAIIPLDAHPLVQAATDAEGMREAFKLAYKQVAMAALAQAPDQETALAWKTEIDKVFK